MNAIIILYMKFASNPIDVIIVAGQSNAVGIPVEKEEIEEYFYEKSDASMLWYRMGGTGSPFVSGKWVPLEPQKMWRGYGMGPEVTMGRTVSQYKSGPVAIIKVAFNSTALSQLPVTDWNPESKNELYDLLVSEVQLALANLPFGYTGKIAGFVWVQGESDAQSKGLKGTLARQPEMASRYKINLQMFIQNLRRDFSYKKLPVLISEISVPEIDSSGREFLYRDLIAQAQYEVAAMDMNIILVHTNGLDKSLDLLHYTVTGQAELGLRLAKYFLAYVSE